MSVSSGSLPQRVPGLPGAADAPPTDGTQATQGAQDPAAALAEAAARAAAQAGDPAASFSRRQANKFSGGTAEAPAAGGQDAWDAAQAAARAAGLPVTSTADLRRLAGQLAQDPRLQAAQAALGQVVPHDQINQLAAQNNGAVAPAAISKAFSESTKNFGAQDRQDLWDKVAKSGKNMDGIDPWALLTIALRGQVEDQNKTLQYDLEKLDMYNKMSKQMSGYSKTLADTQQRLNKAINDEGDNNKKTNVMVDMPEQLTNPDFGSLVDDGTPDGRLKWDNNAKQAAPTPKPESLEDTGKKYRFGKVQWVYRDPASGKEYATNKRSDGERRQEVVAQARDANKNDVDGANKVNSSDLNAKTQMFQQSRDQLDKLTQRWQNRFQTDTETKNQALQALTSILKNMYEMQTGVLRNLL